MRQATIRTILRARLHEVADLPVLRYEAVPQQKAPTVTHVIDELRPGSQARQANGMVQSRPLYLLTIKHPADVALAELDTLADRLAQAFEPGRTLTDDAQTHFCEIESVTPSSADTSQVGWVTRRLSIGLAVTAYVTTFTPA